VTVANLSITGGVSGIHAGASANSTGLTIAGVAVYGNTGHGIDLEASNDGARIVGSVAQGSGQDGMFVSAAGAIITGNSAFGNVQNGIETQGPSPTVTGNRAYLNGSAGVNETYAVHGLIRGNDAYANGTVGIQAHDWNVEARGADRLVVTGNRAHDNKGDGIDTYAGGGTVDDPDPNSGLVGEILVVDNTVYGNAKIGITVEIDVEARNNTVYDNGTDGIRQVPKDYGYSNLAATDDTIAGNHVHGNQGAGIVALVGSTVEGNVSDANGVGIQGTQATASDFLGGSSDLRFTGTIRNNVVYGNTTTGIQTITANSGLIENNTVYQPIGNAVEVTDNASGEGSQNVHLSNNILWAQQGYDIKVANDSQPGFASDYNLLDTTGQGKVGYWQSDLTTLHDWTFDVGQDPHGISADPTFVNPATGDFHLQNGSPAVARGDPASDYSNQPAPSGGRINLGAYGNTAEATTTAAGGVLIATAGVSVNVVEGGADDSFTIALSSKPAANVTITLDPGSELTLTPAKLTFTPADWSTAQTVTVKAVMDSAVEPDHSVAIQASVASSDANYADLALPDIAVAIAEDDGDVPHPPAFTSDAAVTFILGQTNTFTVTASGVPAAALSEDSSDHLPGGVSFDPATGILSGNPAADSQPTYMLHFTAHNGVGNDATQTFTLSVGQPPAFTSADHDTFTVGKAISFPVAASGIPKPTLSEDSSDTLPGGITFDAAKDILAGTPTAASGGTYTLHFTAHNGIGADAAQTFTLTVNEPPTFVSPPTASFLVNAAGSFTVAASGYPQPSLSESSTDVLPANVGFDPATGILSGSPSSAGTYTLHFTAHSDSGPDASQTVVLTVAQVAVTLNPPTPTEGEPLANLPVASFMAAPGIGDPSLYQVKVNWGDKQHSSTGAHNVTIQADPDLPGVFDVLATKPKPYSRPSAGRTLTVTITVPGFSVTQKTVIRVADAPIALTLQPPAPTAGERLVRAYVGTFTDANTRAGRGSFTVTVDWGDGQVSRGRRAVIVSRRGDEPGTFDIFATKPAPYAPQDAELTFTVNVTDKNGGATDSQSAAITIG
jgi:hypothetical protein